MERERARREGEAEELLAVVWLMRPRSFVRSQEREERAVGRNAVLFPPLTRTSLYWLYLEKETREGARQLKAALKRQMAHSQLLVRARRAVEMETWPENH